jgi:hypothetical protein
MVFGQKIQQYLDGTKSSGDISTVILHSLSQEGAGVGEFLGRLQGGQGQSATHMAPGPIVQCQGDSGLLCKNRGPMHRTQNMAEREIWLNL